jgi:hypothetical protein
MFIIGLILLLLGFLLGIPVVYTLGVILLVVGLILMLVGTDRTLGRRWW